MKTLNSNTNGITSERTSHAARLRRLFIELTGEPVSLKSIFIPHVLNVAILQNKLSKLGTVTPWFSEKLKPAKLKHFT
jgi:hypothetical protein